MRFNVQSPAAVAFSLLALLSMVDEMKAGVAPRQDVASPATTITLANNIPAQQPMSQPEERKLDGFARALLETATRLARDAEPPLERAEVLQTISGAYRWSGNDEVAQEILSEAHQSILQIESVAVRIKKLGELAGHHRANYQNRTTAIALLEEAEQLLPFLPDVPEEQHYALSELTFRYGNLGDAEKAIALVENLPEPFSRHSQQASIIHTRIYSQVEQGTSADELLAELKSLERPYSLFDGVTTVDCCDEDCCGASAPGEEEPGSKVATQTDWQMLLELQEIARRYVEAGNLQEAEVTLVALQDRLEQLPLSASLLNFKVSLASFFQHSFKDRRLWSAALDDALATLKRIQADPALDAEALSFLPFDLMQLTSMLGELGRTEEAIALLQIAPTAQESLADQVDRLLMLATAHHNLNQPEAALAVLSQAAQLSKADSQGWDYQVDQTWRQIRVGGEYLALQENELAWEILKPIWLTAQQTEADEFISQEDLWTLFDYLVQLEKTDEAIALAQATDLEDRLTDFISTLASQGKLDAAIALIPTLEDPRSLADAWTYIAAGHGAQGQLDLADQALEQTWAVIQTLRAEDATETDQETQIHSLEYIANLYYNSSRPEQMEAQALRLSSPVLRAALIQALLQYQGGAVEISPTLLDFQFETLQQISPAQWRSHWSLALMHRYAARQDYGSAIAVTAALDPRHRQASNLIHLLDTYLDQPEVAIDSAALEQQLLGL